MLLLDMPLTHVTALSVVCAFTLKCLKIQPITVQFMPLITFAQLNNPPLQGSPKTIQLQSYLVLSSISPKTIQFQSSLVLRLISPITIQCRSS